MSIKRNAKEIAPIVGVSVSMIYKLVKDGEIPFYRIGDKPVFDEAEIEQWLLSKKVTPGIIAQPTVVAG